MWPPSYSIKLPAEQELEASPEKDTEASRLFPLTYAKALEERAKLAVAELEAKLDVLPGAASAGPGPEGTIPAAPPASENDTSPGMPDDGEGGEGGDGGDAALERGDGDGQSQQKKKQKPKKKTGKKKK